MKDYQSLLKQGCRPDCKCSMKTEKRFITDSSHYQKSTIKHENLSLSSVEKPNNSL